MINAQQQAHEWLQKRRYDNGQRLTIYASGSGSLSFVWQTIDRNATSELVRYRDAKSLQFLGNYMRWSHRDDDFDDSFQSMELVWIESRWQMIDMFTVNDKTGIATRVSDGLTFTFKIDKQEPYGYRLDTVADLLSGEPSCHIKHLSTLAAFNFYMAHREEIHKQPLHVYEVTFEYFGNREATLEVRSWNEPLTSDEIRAELVSKGYVGVNLVNAVKVI